MKKVMITGGSSMVARAIMRQFRKIGFDDYRAFYHCDYDLIDQNACHKIFAIYRPNEVIHLAGLNGGLAYNEKYPVSIYGVNTRIALNMLETAMASDVETFHSVIPSCSYPNKSPLKEEDYYVGKPANSVACHGLAKRTLVTYGEMINKEDLMNCIATCCNTIYGPHDNFSGNGKVMAGLIRKIIEAKKQNLPSLPIKGSGLVSRGFIYCDDAATAIIECLDKQKIPVLNIPSEDCYIRTLATVIKFFVDYKGDFIWESDEYSEKDGQKHKSLDATLSKSIISYEPQYSLDHGIEETVKWCYDNCDWAK